MTLILIITSVLITRTAIKMAAASQGVVVDDGVPF